MLKGEDDQQLLLDTLNLDADINNGKNINIAALLREAALDMSASSDADPLVTFFGTARKRSYPSLQI
jgi:hypothetical protein